VLNLDVERIRSQIPALQRSIYLNTGGTGPLPRAVTAEIADTYRALGDGGPDVTEIRGPIEEQFERTRGAVADLFGVTPEEIAFTRSVSEGLSTVAYGMDWRAGDEVIVTDEEHPSGIMLWLNLARRAGIRVRKLPLVADRDELLSRLRDMVSPRTRLLSLSHVTTDTGTRLPAAEICRLAREHDVPVVFDAAQSAGQFPVDLRDMDCDFYACTGHKWLLGGWGTGMLYVKDDWTTRLNVSWTGSKAGAWDPETDALEFADTAHRFEFGGRHLPLYNGMGRGIEFVESVGTENVETRVRGLTARLKAAIKEIPGAGLRSPEPPELSTGIVTFSVGGLTGAELNDRMWERWKVKGRPALSDTAMRLSVTFFNSDDEIETVISAIAALANENR
jgi:selenocysteine lyase/cysteine desulfurase